MLFYAIEGAFREDLLSKRRIDFPTYVSVCGKANKKSAEERVKHMYSIDLQSRIPIYEQLYKKVVELVLKGELKAGDKLPSVRELAKNLGVNPNTVSKAFQLLERGNVIYSLAGRGSFVSNINTDAVKETALEDFDRAVSEALNAGITKEELGERILGNDFGGGK